MRKGRFDTRSLEEVVLYEVSMRTELSDGVELDVIYHGQQKPTVRLTTHSLKPEYQNLNETLDLTTWLPDQPLSPRLDGAGRVMEGEYVGAETWKDYMESANGLLNILKKSITVMGRNITIKVGV